MLSGYIKRGGSMTGISTQNRSLSSRLKRYSAVYIIMIPGLVYFIVFKIFTLWGNLFAFMDYNVVKGIFGSTWVGLKHFRRLFAYEDLWVLIRNTFVISGMRLLFGFPVPILLALFLNDMRNQIAKRTMQSLVYLPHFISWPVVAAMTMELLAPNKGLVNSVIKSLGGQEIFFLMNENLFRPVIVFQGIWKEAGYGTIMYLAALASVDMSLYEAADIDGCSRWQKTWNISLPTIKSTVIILFLLQLGPPD
jgi:putative aldouronate transport system permease protein